MTAEYSTSENIVIFDGVCNFCNGAVNFILTRDRRGTFRFSPAQSSAGGELLKKHGLAPDNLDSFLLIHRGKAYTKSDAALVIVRELPGPWKLLYACKVIPKQIRDYLYSLLVKNRYRWFGQRDQCMIPTSDQRQKFIL